MALRGRVTRRPRTMVGVMSLRSLVARVPGARALFRAAKVIANRVRIRPSAPPVDAAPHTAPRSELRRLALSNRFSLRRVTNPDSDVVVTMTTHGDRIQTVHTAIESIARGSRRPRRLILWLDDREAIANPPRALRRLRRRGLEILEAPHGYRVHTKYYFYVTSTDHHHTMPMVTSDDDIIYPPHWLASMERAHVEHPDSIVTFRAHQIRVSAEGLEPYATWSPCTNTVPSFAHFGTSVSGQLFPPPFLDYVRGEGEAFRQLSADNDDIWLHYLAVKSGVRTAQVLPDSQHFLFVPGTQESGLYLTNVWGQENDRQAERSYGPDEIERIRSDLRDRP